MSGGKWITGLAPEMPVTDAARVVFAARFEVVRQFLPLAAERCYEDPEHVHQLRVGTRRAGAALTAFADWLPKKQRKALKGTLRAIRRAAGDARDWDVFIQGLQAAAPLRTDPGKPARDFLLGYAIGERSAAQVRLAEAAAEHGSELATRSAELPDCVREPTAGSPPATFGGLATIQLGSLFAEFAAAVRADPADPAGLHRLRIRGKHLRYAIEIFAGCFAPPLTARLYPAVEALQELLGGSQDAAVGVERLERLRAVAQQIVPGEWPRLRSGFTGLLRVLRAKLKSGRKKFRTWCGEWEKLVAEHPFGGLGHSTRAQPDATPAG